jgi:hypothetical protein
MNLEFKNAGTDMTPEEFRLLTEVMRDFPEVAKCICESSKLWERQIDVDVEK